jgi:hypothetical protein
METKDAAMYLESLCQPFLVLKPIQLCTPAVNHLPQFAPLILNALDLPFQDPAH